MCIDNAETRALNIQNHVAELQLIPRAFAQRRGVDSDYPLTPPALSGLQADGHLHFTHSGHSNYVLWRNLRGQ